MDQGHFSELHLYQFPLVQLRHRPCRERSALLHISKDRGSRRAAINAAISSDMYVVSVRSTAPAAYASYQGRYFARLDNRVSVFVKMDRYGEPGQVQGRIGTPRGRFLGVVLLGLDVRVLDGHHVEQFCFKKVEEPRSFRKIMLS